MRKNICRKQRRNSSEIEHRIAIAFLISIFIFFGKYNTVVILNVIGYQGSQENRKIFYETYINYFDNLYSIFDKSILPGNKKQ